MTTRGRGSVRKRDQVCELAFGTDDVALMPAENVITD